MIRMLSTTLLKRKIGTTGPTQVRHFWEYVNMMFNRPDEERIKLVGPDRACAEWVLKNGGTVTWSSGETLEDFNFLPPEGVKKTLMEIDGSNSSISHYGFDHLIGCKSLKKVTLHNNKYIEDRALKGLSHGKETLQHLQVSKCINVTDVGVKEISALKNLNTLLMFSLKSVENLDDCKTYLQTNLANCKIETKEQ